MISFKQAFAALRALAAVAVLGVLVSGCANSGVELNGKVFELMGVNGVIGGEKEEAHLSERGGLVIPPDTKRLPKPGEQTNVAAANSGEWPVSREARQKQAEDARAARVREMCADRGWYEGNENAVNPELKKEFDRVTKNGTLCNPMLGGLLN